MIRGICVLDVALTRVDIQIEMTSLTFIIGTQLSNMLTRLTMAHTVCTLLVSLHVHVLYNCSK